MAIFEHKQFTALTERKITENTQITQNKLYRPDDGETICPADGHFGSFRRLGDTYDHGNVGT